MPSIDEVEDKIIADATTGMADDKKMMFKTEYYGKRKNAWITFVLNFFLGSIGIHQFYLGNMKKGITYIVLAVVGYVLYYIAMLQMASGLIAGLEMTLEGNMENAVESMAASMSPFGYVLLFLGGACLLVICVMWLIDIFTFIKNTKIANEKIATSIKARI